MSTEKEMRVKVMCREEKKNKTEAKVDIRPGAITNPESESKDESGFDSGFGIMCSGIGSGVGIV